MRYTYDIVLANLTAAIVSRFGPIEDRNHKDLYEDPRVGIERSQWNRKFKGETKYTYEEISGICEFFGAPPGWPFISWDQADAIRRAEERLAQLATVKATAPPPPGPAPAPPSGQPRGQKRTAGHK